MEGQRVNYTKIQEADDNCPVELNYIQQIAILPILKCELDDGEIKTENIYDECNTIKSEAEIKNEQAVVHPELNIKPEDIDISQQSECESFQGNMFLPEANSLDPKKEKCWVVQPRGSSPETLTYKCEMCLYCSKYKSDLKRHMVTHRSPSKITEYKCAYCSFGTNYKNSFKRHIMNHESPSDVKVYKCELCPFQTKYGGSFVTHISNHKDSTEIKYQYQCSTCSFKAKSKRCLREHMLIHKPISEVTMYQCNVCVYKTNRGSNIKSHMLTHKSDSEFIESKDQEVGNSGISKNRQGKRLHNGQRLMAFNIYTRHKNEGNSKSNSVTLAASEIGISKTTLWGIIAEMEKTGHLTSPPKKRTRKSLNEKLDENQKKRIRWHVHSLFLKNEPPTINTILEALQNDETLPPIGRTSLWILLKKLGFVWEKLGRTSFLIPGRNLDECESHEG